MFTVTLTIDGMTCISCERKIEEKLRTTIGVKEVEVSYAAGTAVISYDDTLISLDEIEAIIHRLGYRVQEDEETTSRKTLEFSKILGTALILLSLYILMSRLGFLNIFNAFPRAEENMSYGMLFIIGLLTSLHCIAMCGGINLSVCMTESNRSNATFTPSLLYNTGRVISYTLTGGLVGALGSVISFSGTMKGIVQLVAGVFMIIMGLNMLNIFPQLRKLNIRMPRIFAKTIEGQKAGKGPLLVGLLNGLMPCGPLQSMQIYALSTGSPIKGAIAMFLFSIGTLPLMFGFGAIGSLMSKKFAKRLMTVCSILVVALGVLMIARGMSLAGLSLPDSPISGDNKGKDNIAVMTDSIQTVTTKLESGRYVPIIVQKGIPVKWIIHAEEKDINGCNNEIYIPEYNIEKKLEPGDNVIEFTPTESGKYVYTCWMGMIRSSITVVDDIDDIK